jgi:L-iditol 2-dehydrogenase
MKGAYLVAPERIEVRDAPRPEDGPDVTTLDVRSVGLCGTDLSVFAGSIPVELPRVLGHEVVGEIRDPGASGLDPGTPVIVDPGLSCGACPQCLEGRTNICTRGGLLGRDADGGLRETMVVPSSHVHALPAALDEQVAPLLQVLATCIHAQRLVEITPGERVVVLGLGVTGLLHLQLAKLRGASSVIGVSRSKEKLTLARRLGADGSIPAGEDAVATIADEGGVDIVIEAAGTSATLAQAVRMARVGGRILAYGTITHDDDPLPYYDLYYKELAVIGARSACAEDFPAAIEAAVSERVALAPLVSARFGLDTTEDALRAAIAPGVLKVIVDV